MASGVCMPLVSGKAPAGQKGTSLTPTAGSGEGLGLGVPGHSLVWKRSRSS